MAIQSYDNLIEHYNEVGKMLKGLHDNWKTYNSYPFYFLRLTSNFFYPGL